MSTNHTHAIPSCLTSGPSIASSIPCTIPYWLFTKSAICLCVTLFPIGVHPRSPIATMTAPSILPPTDDATYSSPGRTQQSIRFHPVGTITTRISLDHTHAHRVSLQEPPSPPPPSPVIDQSSTFHMFFCFFPTCGHIYIFKDRCARL